MRRYGWMFALPIAGIIICLIIAIAVEIVYLILLVGAAITVGHF